MVLPESLPRLDRLRLQLLRWYVQWNTFPRPETIVRRMSETALHHPDVLLARGDVALETGDLELARTCYEEALAARPGDTKTLLCLATVHYLSGNREGFQRHLDESIAGADTPEEMERVFDTWQGFYSRADFSAAMAPVVAAVEMDPSRTNLLTRIYTLNGLNREADATRAIEEFLRAFPGDAEGLELLRRVRAE